MKSSGRDFKRVAIRADDDNLNGRQFYVRIIDAKHEYADGDPLERGFYKYIGVKDFQDSRIRAFEEVEIPEALQKLYKP